MPGWSECLVVSSRQSAAEGHVWVLQKPGSELMSVAPVATEDWLSQSGQPPETTVVSKGHASNRSIQIWEAWTDTWNHGDIWARATAQQTAMCGYSPSYTHGLCWCPWFLLPLKTMWMPRFYATTWGHVTVKDCTAAGDMPILESCSVTWGNGYIYSCYCQGPHQGLCWNLRPVLTPKALEKPGIRGRAQGGTTQKGGQGPSS